MLAHPSGSAAAPPATAGPASRAAGPRPTAPIRPELPGERQGMNPIVRSLNTLMGARMAQSGRFVQIETLGRRTGEWRATPVGYEHAGDGALFIGAGSATAHWAHNLLAHPFCRASIGGTTLTYRAEHLLEGARNAALRAIQGRYGPGMADRIGGGPVFRLVPVTEEAGHPRS